MMKRRVIRRFFSFFAHGCVWAWLVTAVGLTLVFAMDVAPRRTLSLLDLLACAGAGVCVSTVVAIAFRRLLTAINGGPFHEGDTVEIVLGPHRGKTARVCEELKGQCAVRVDLGGEAASRAEDVFPHCCLVRVRRPDAEDQHASSEPAPPMEED